MEMKYRKFGKKLLYFEFIMHHCLCIGIIHVGHNQNIDMHILWLFSLLLEHVIIAFDYYHGNQYLHV